MFTTGRRLKLIKLTKNAALKVNELTLCGAFVKVEQPKALHTSEFSNYPSVEKKEFASQGILLIVNGRHVEFISHSLESHFPNVEIDS